MSTDAASTVGDSLEALLKKEGIERIAIVDDAFDSMAQRGLTSEESDDLWRLLEFDEAFRTQVEEFGRTVESAGDLEGELIDELLENQSEVPRFMDVWPKSLAGTRMSEAVGSVTRLRDQLKDSLNLKVQTFGSDTEPSTLISYGPQLLFLDWYLGDDAPQTVGDVTANKESHTAVQAAVETARGILRDWPKDKPKPLIVLMSSRPGVESYAGDFCRRAEVLRGMFHAVPKATLNDPFSLRLHLHLFAMSAPAGRRIQAFMDTLREEFMGARKRFLTTIADLTVTDYAYIQRLCLQKEGQPLGDYLVWLFSTYLGQLLFAEALKDVRNDLDGMTFEKALPSLGPPSDTLTEIYHTALFDTSVGPVVSHPLAHKTPYKGVYPGIALGDILRYQDNSAQQGNCDDAEGSHNGEDESQHLCRSNGEEVERSGENEEDATSECAIGGDSNPDLLLLINAQCDLAFRPSSEGTLESVEQLAILLLPGFLKPVGHRSSNRSKPKTELYQQNGQNNRVEWDTKNVRAIPVTEFREWTGKTGYERVARLRLPFALEIQRAFAADVTRVGSPIMPPIYQPISIQLLHPNPKGNAYESADGLEEDEAAFLVLTRDGQQCVLTLPLIAKLKKLLEAKRVTLEDAEWASLQSPFKLPSLGKPRVFSNGRFRMEREAKEGQRCNSSIAITLGIQIDDGDSS